MPNEASSKCHSSIFIAFLPFNYSPIQTHCNALMNMHIVDINLINCQSIDLKLLLESPLKIHKLLSREPARPAKVFRRSTTTTTRRGGGRWRSLAVVAVVVAVGVVKS